MPGCDCPLANLVFENAKNDGQFHRIATGLLKINKEKKTFSIRVWPYPSYILYLLARNKQQPLYK